MPVVVPELVHLYVSAFGWPGAPPPSSIPSKIYVGDTAYDSSPDGPSTADTFQFGPSHPARTALDADPDSYWFTGQRRDDNLGGDEWGNLYMVLPPYPEHTPVTFRFYAYDVSIAPSWPPEMPVELEINRVPPVDVFSTQWHIFPLTPLEDGVWVGEWTGYPLPGAGEDYHAVVRVHGLMSWGYRLRLKLFHVTAEWEAQGGGWRRLRQRQSLTGADSWPLRQRQNGAASGSWPLRQRQRGL